MDDAPPPEVFDHRDLRGSRFLETNLSGSRFVEADLSGAVLRGVEFRGVEIDTPWLFEDGNTLLVNGVDVLPFVEAQLDRRFPGRNERRTADPVGLRQAWSHLEVAWTAALDRAAELPVGSVDVQVDGEWSFAQTLRHLILATDTWLRRAIWEKDQPFHPYGLAVSHSGYAVALDPTLFADAQPTYTEVLRIRAGRQAMVRDFLATVTADDLRIPRQNPWSPRHRETTLSCVHVILQEEWEHLRYALRDLDALSTDRS